jgi:hypothetical protein
LQPDSGSSCNWYTLWVANTECFRLILYCPFRVATRQWFELQSIYTKSCKYRVLPLDTILPLQLQPDNGSSCNWYTLRVANTECFRLILYYPFSCNPTMARVAIDIHSELQILSAFVWLYYPSCCIRIVVRVAIDVQSELQVLLPDTLIPIQLQPDRGSSCNWCKTPSCKYWVLPPDTILLLPFASGKWFELQSMNTPSCKYWVFRDFT